jgi:2-desacetyl-2-hydroxyethyl bacteriochlorophyllide A dehydrogenase
MNMSSSIRALVCTTPGELELVHRPAPVADDGEALVRIRRVGICGTDYHILEGVQPYLSYPRVMGHELAVEVVENKSGAGPAVGDLCTIIPYVSCGRCHACRRGKPNCCQQISVLGVHRDGGMTDLISLPVQNLIPANGLTVDECAIVEFLAIGAHAVRRGGVSAADRALIVGAGPIGLGAALFAALAGAEVTIIDREARRLNAAQRLVKLRHAVVASDSSDSRLAAMTDGNGFDVVFDATGSGAAIQHGFAYLAHGGRYVLISVVQGDIAFSDADFHRKEVTLSGSRNATREDFDSVMTAIRSGAVRVNSWITHRTTLSNAVADLPAWAADRSGVVKAVIELDR